MHCANVIMGEHFKIWLTFYEKNIVLNISKATAEFENENISHVRHQSEQLRQPSWHSLESMWSTADRCLVLIHEIDV